MARILIAGCGYVGSALASRLVAEGHAVFGVRRNAGALPPGVEPIAADLAEGPDLRSRLEPAVRDGVDAVVYAAAADRGDDAAYRSTYVDGLRHTLDVVSAASKDGAGRPAVLFTSSTGVYGQRDGSWVDEDSATEPSHFTGRRMLEAEAVLAASRLPGTALRLGGIYGPGRRRLIDRVREGLARMPSGPPRYTNRIHREDAAGALHHLIDRVLGGGELPPILVGVDDEPADEAEVLRWPAARLGVAEPPRAESSSDEPSARDRRGSNKRCRNARLRATGYRFRYPSFREGYAALLEPAAPTRP